ncbi:hypothetical protein F2Q69_00023669 [Brassica cretica]|uniref:RING-type domain-containing protein n=1 Tax=Brassica cretica TaxID=69181 RepID=A0A8S9Q643_BRACR|nr:hypothetical protein F2Q69_00023669 [Brassica cretica]
MISPSVFRQLSEFKSYRTLGPLNQKAISHIISTNLQLLLQLISKRQRDHTFDINAPMPSQKRRSCAFEPQTSYIDAQIQQQQSEIDRFVAQQTETLRLELEARQQTQTRILASAVQSAIIKTLKAKDDEIARMGKLNGALQERVKSLYVENQIWRDLAQTNEATANTLRSNLEKVLAQVDDFPGTVNGGDGFCHSVEEDAVSSCGSCEGADGDDVTAVTGGCRRCGEKRASVLVLPCRHCVCVRFVDRLCYRRVLYVIRS